METEGQARGVCPHDCPDTCSIIATVRNGRLTGLRGDPDHPVTAGYLCAKYARAHERVYAPDRLLHPLRRVGRKGEGRFRRIGWDEAIGEIAGRWRDIVATAGPQAILPFFGSGNEGLVQGRISGRRFFNRLGTLQLDRTICTKAGRTAYVHTMGSSAMADPTMAHEAELIVLWGVNPASTNLHQLPLIKRARTDGAAIVVVNPTRIGGIPKPELWLRPRPGTDAAVVLAVMHVILREGWHDRDFITDFTFGFPALEERLRAYPPRRAAAVADVPAADIERLARLYAERRRSLIHVGPGCLRHGNAGATMRAIACLPALTGAWLQPGGGLYFPTSTAFPFDWSVLDGDELRPTPARRYNMVHLARHLLDDDAPVSSLYVFDGNPAVTLYNQSQVRRGLMRDDLFTVVHELRMTDTARFADIVLPATTPFEHSDIQFSYYQPELLLNRPAIAPVGEARSNRDVFRALASAFGFSEPCLRTTAEEVVTEVANHPRLPLDAAERTTLFRDGRVTLRVEPIDRRFRHDVPASSRPRIALHAPVLAAQGIDPLPGYMPSQESREATPDRFARFPLSFLTPSAHSTLNANQGGEPALRRAESRPLLWINPADARDRNLADGDPVRIHNDRGHCRMWARVTEETRPGVVVAPGQWWGRCYPDGMIPNFTTPDFVADMGGGSAFNSNLVEVTSAVSP